MPKVPKLAPKALEHRAPSPLIAWIRDYLLAVKRNKPAGIPGPDGEVCELGNIKPKTLGIKCGI